VGKTRTGARTFLFVVQHACKLSHTAGFVGGLRTIIGSDDADTLYALWTPFCSLLESLISLDDWWNRRDATLPDSSGGEDAPFG
jgi:hypothetical protein